MDRPIALLISNRVIAAPVVSLREDDAHECQLLLVEIQLVPDRDFLSRSHCPSP